MTVSKETIYNFIDALDLGRIDAKETSLKFKRDGFVEFRNLLQDYDAYSDEEIIDNPRYSDEYVECFIDAAIKEDDFEDRYGYYAANAVGIPGGILCTALIYAGVSILAMNDKRYAPPQDGDHLAVLASRFLGALLGSGLFIISVRNVLEMQIFREDAFDCSDSMFPLELYGALSSEGE